MVEKLMVGDTIKIKQGKKGNLVGFDDFGKVVLFRNEKKLRKGFVRITELEEKDKFYVAKGEQTAWDYYNGISLEEFKEVLKKLDFKIGFELKYAGYTCEETHIMAYNMDNGIIIMCKTFNSKPEDVSMYVPNLNAMKFIRSNYFSYGGSKETVFSLCNTREDVVVTPLRCLLKLANSDERSRVWPSDSAPSMRNAGDSSEVGDIENNDLSYSRILLANAEIEELFPNNRFFKKYFDQRRLSE